MLIAKLQLHKEGTTIKSPGGTEVFVADKLFISTRLGCQLEIANSITCFYRTVLDVNYLFHAESALKKII